MHRTLLSLAVVSSLAAVAFVVIPRLGAHDPVVVDVVVPERRDLATTIELTGTVINDRTVTVTALLDGEIVDIGAREGDVVATGDALATLDNRFAATELYQARSELTLARQVLSSAMREHARNQTLSAQGQLSRLAMDDSADALARATIELRLAEATVRLVALRLANATVTAPYAGTLTHRDAEIGQWVEAGTRLFTLVASDGDVVEARVDAADTARVALDQAVTLSSDGWPGRTWTSTVSWISPDVTGDDGTANRFAVRMAPGEGAPALKLGERVDVSLETERREGILVLPLDALDEHAPGRYRVLVVDEAGIARQQEVATGLVTIDFAEITDGLEERMRIVTPAGAVAADVTVREREPAPGPGSNARP